MLVCSAALRRSAAAARHGACAAAAAAAARPFCATAPHARTPARADAPDAGPLSPATEVDIERLVPAVAPVARTHGVHVATLHLRAYGPARFELDFFADFANRTAHALQMPTGGIAKPPTRTSLWTVPRGPFVHKKTQENFWRRTHQRAIKVYDANDRVVDRWLHFLRLHEMPGVASKVELFRAYPLGVGAQIGAPTHAAHRADASTQDEIRRIADVFVREHTT